jgi:hypothetical protein
LDREDGNIKKMNDIVKVNTWKEKDILLYDDNINNWNFYDVNGNKLERQYVKGINYRMTLNKTLVKQSIILNKCKVFMSLRHHFTSHLMNLFIEQDDIILNRLIEYVKSEHRPEYFTSYDRNGIVQLRKNPKFMYSLIHIIIIIPAIRVNENIVSFLSQEQDNEKIFLYDGMMWLDEMKTAILKELTDVFANVSSDGLSFDEYINEWTKKLLKEFDMEVEQNGKIRKRKNKK